MRRAASELAFEVLYAMRPAPDPADELGLEDEAQKDDRVTVPEFVEVLTAHIPDNYPPDYVDDANAQLDGALRACATLDPELFLKCVRDQSKVRRTNVLCGLEDHGEMIASFRPAK